MTGSHIRLVMNDRESFPPSTERLTTGESFDIPTPVCGMRYHSGAHAHAIFNSLPDLFNVAREKRGPIMCVRWNHVPTSHIHMKTTGTVIYGPGKYIEAAFATRHSFRQRTQASVFLMVAVCWITHSLLRDIILLAGVEVQRLSNSRTVWRSLVQFYTDHCTQSNTAAVGGKFTEFLRISLVRAMAQCFFVL